MTNRRRTGRTVGAAKSAIVQRLVHVVLVLFFVSIITMLMLELTPGDPGSAILGDTATQEQVDALNERLGYDESVASRYVRWVADAAQGDLGTSVVNNRPVVDSLKQRLPVTIELAVLAQIMALAIAVPIALLGAHRPDRSFDQVSRAATSVMISAPSFLIALLLAYIFGLRLGWLPVTGWTPLTENVGENLRSAFLPALTLACTEIAVISRVLRTDVAATLRENFILNAKARGLRPRYILFRHALRPSSFSLITLAGLAMGRLLGGAIIVETIFALPGLGQLMVTSVQAHDFPTVQGAVLFVAVVYVFANAAVDLLYVVLDPRVQVVR